MGADIEIWTEIRNKKTGKWIRFEEEYFSVSDWERKTFNKIKAKYPFDWRSYSMFGFLADVRNYSECECISEPKGLPTDSEYLNEDGYYSGGGGWGSNDITKKREIETDGMSHSFSYLTLRELLEFDYAKKFVDQRDNTDTYLKEITHREHLGGMFFVHLEELKQLGEPDDVRIVFFFDN